MYAYLVAAIVGLVALGAAGFQGFRLGSDHVRAEYAARDLRDRLNGVLTNWVEMHGIDAVVA